MPNRTRVRLSPAGAVSLLALFLALGGVSYAALTLPPDSVGTKQLRSRAVTAPKLADGAVHRRAISSRVANGLVHPIRYSAQGTAAGTDTEVVFDVAGLKFEASCQSSGGQTQLYATVISVRDAVIQDQFNVDTGTDPTVPGPLQSGTIQIDLQAGQPLDLQQPQVASTDFFRVMAKLVYSGGHRVITADVATFVDGITGECTVYGTASAA
jgi:hypothetical protein